MANEIVSGTTKTQVERPQRVIIMHREDEKLHGKSFQINENSVEEGDPIHASSAPQQPSAVPRDEKLRRDSREEKLQGKSFQVNENSVEEGEPVHPRTGGSP